MPDDSRCPRAEHPTAADQVLLLMRAVTAIGSRLTELPARPGEKSATAGLTFTLSRGPLGFGSAHSARTLLAERWRSASDPLHPKSLSCRRWQTGWIDSSHIGAL